MSYNLTVWTTDGTAGSDLGNYKVLRISLLRLCIPTVAGTHYMSISTDSDRYRVNDQDPCFSININECIIANSRKLNFTAHLNATHNTNVELDIGQAVVTINDSNKMECGENKIIHSLIIILVLYCNAYLTEK